MSRLSVVIALVLLAPASAIAADMPVKAKTPAAMPMLQVQNWTGFYIGGHAGYATTSPSLSAPDLAAITAVYGGAPKPQGFSGGVHAGYDQQFQGPLVAGVGVEINGFGIDAVNDTTGLAGTSLKSKVDWEVAVYGRLGYSFGRFMPYVLAGGTWVHNEVNGVNGFIGAFSVSNWHSGFTVGGGIAMMLTDRWSGRVQYRYVDVDSKTYLNRSISSTGSVIDFGLSYRL